MSLGGLEPPTFRLKAKRAYHCATDTRGRHGNPLQYSCLENPHGQSSLAGYSLWGPKESDTAEVTYTHTHTQNCLESPVKSKIHNGQPNGTMSNHIIGKRRVTWQCPRSSKPMTLTRLPTVRLASSAGSTSAAILSRDGCPYQYFVTLLNSPLHLG